MDDAILRLPQVKQMVGLGRTLIYQLRAEGNFPAPVKLGKRSVGWRKSEIAAWIAKRSKVRGD